MSAASETEGQCAYRNANKSGKKDQTTEKQEKPGYSGIEKIEMKNTGRHDAHQQKNYCGVKKSH
jgi:hypothetical protein